MRYHNFFVASLVLASAVLHAQYVGPSHRSLKFRIYGKNAKPVNEKNKEYKSSVSFEEGRQERENRCSSRFEGDTLNVGVTEMFETQRPVKLEVSHGSETMVVESAGDIDSLPFTGGQYFIPRAFSPLFAGKALQNLKITNRGLSNFKAGIRPAAVTNLNSALKLTGRFVDGYYYSKKDKTLILLEQPTGEGGVLSYRFAMSNTDGLQWRYVSVSGLGNKELVKQVIASSGHRYLLAERKETNKDILTKVVPSNQFYIDVSLIMKWDLQGNVHLDSVLTGLKIYSLQFISELVGFALGQSTKLTSNFYRTLDGGRTWEQMYNSIKIDDGKIIYFSDAQHGILSGKGQEGWHYFKTSDAGRSWEKYVPPIRSLEDSKNDETVIDKAHSLYYDWKNSGVVLISGDKTVYKPNPVLEETCRILSPRDEISLMINAYYLLYSSDNRKTWKYYPYIFDRETGNFPYYAYRVYDACLLNEERLLLFSDKGLYLVDTRKLK